MIPASVVILIFGVGGFVLFMAAVAHGSGQGAVFSLGLMGIAALGLFSRKRQQTGLNAKEISQAVKAAQEKTLPEREVSQVGEANPNLSPEQVAEKIGQQLAAVFSDSHFMELFKEQTLAPGWSLGDALAIWYSLGNLALVVATWSVSGWDQAKRFRIIDHGRVVLEREWGISGATKSRLIQFINETEGSAVASYSRAINTYGEGKSSTGLQVFFRRYVSCILGKRVAFTSQSTFADIAQGVEYASNDLITDATICDIFTRSVFPALELLRESPIDWNISASQGK